MSVVVRVRSQGAGEAGWGREWGQPLVEADGAPGLTLILLGTRPEGPACSGGRPLADGVPRFTGVQSAAVNVICELARRNPKNYLSLAPLFFKLMTSSTNNWVLIKIIKLASVAPGVSWTRAASRAPGCHPIPASGDRWPLLSPSLVL